MGDIKIPSGSVEGQAIEAAETVRESVESATESSETARTTGVDTDSVEQIAADVAAGKIGRPEAVERILADVFGSEMVKNAPAGLKEELETVLQTMLEDDPHLQSLVAAIGPHEIE